MLLGLSLRRMITEDPENNSNHFWIITATSIMNEQAECPICFARITATGESATNLSLHMSTHSKEEVVAALLGRTRPPTPQQRSAESASGSQALNLSSTQNALISGVSIEILCIHLCSFIFYRAVWTNVKKQILFFSNSCSKQYKQLHQYDLLHYKLRVDSFQVIF